jgi:predicted deacylase
MSEDKFKIDGTFFKPGEDRSHTFRIARLPSGHEIDLYIHIFRSTEPGPCILLLGGVHGDEVNGIEIVRRMSTSGVFKELNKGSVITIPLLNAYGFINYSRELMDGKDVNRSFPGNFKGSLASRIARTITKKVMPHVDMLIDFHTGGNYRYNYPQVRYTTNDHGSERLAKVFGAPYSIIKDPINRSLRQFCFKEEIPCIVYEGGQSLLIDEFSVQEAIQGVQRVLMSHEMIDGQCLEKDCLIFEKASWIRAQESGLFIWKKQSGDLVEMNDIIGELHDPYGLKKSDVRANRSGFIIGHQNGPVVHQGDALFNIGYKWEKFKSEI